MAKTGEAERDVELDLDMAASLARSEESKTPESSSDSYSTSRLTSQFSAQGSSEDESQLIAAFLSASRASKRLLTLKLLANPAVERFPDLLQFFLRVMMAVHARSHSLHTVKEQPELESCSYAQNTAESCISYEQEESTAGSTGFHACLAAHYGSVKRLKCEEVWHGDHMAYRCRTCGLSDSSCMCLACFDPEEHEGHDYRVYRCSSGGCCDCGDPLAWKPEGFCKKHSAQKSKPGQSEHERKKMKMGTEEDAVVQILVRRAMEFCVDVLREVHLSCLRPHASENPDLVYPRRSLPRTGLLRSALPSVVKTHVDRLQQTLAWLQMLSMSCLYYRNMISDLFFEELPPEFQLDAAVSTQMMTRKKKKKRLNYTPLLLLDVFLKAGILLPVETCDQKYTCHFVEWYPYFIELYLSASDENNEDGMRNLSRFIDRLFCQLFHSNAQLRELETVFASMRPTFNRNETHKTRRRRRRRPHHIPGVPPLTTDSTPSSCVEWLMVFLLEKLNDLFRSTLRLMTILPQPLIDGTPTGVGDASGTTSTSTVGIGTVPEAPPVLRTVQAMDLQTRHVHRHIEYESQNWTFAFVADYELKLLLSAFLTGIPACFSREVWMGITAGEKSWNQGAMGTTDDWRELLGMGLTDDEQRKDLAFWYSALDHPLRVLLFSREIKAGLWVRNGGVMLQQLIIITRSIGDTLVFTRICSCVNWGPAFYLTGASRVSSFINYRLEFTDTSLNADRSRELRQELDVVEEALRLLLQILPETAAVWLLEREIMHWLTLGPFTRSEVIMRTDMKLVEQIKQLSTHEWAEFEEEEILTHVLESVGVYEDPSGSNSGPRTARSGSLLGYGLKMSGSWKLKPELWSSVSPLFECFTPSEAQQCEQNIRKNLPKSSDQATPSIILPMLPRPQLEGSSGVDMHGLLAETMLNSSYMASVLRESSATNENLLLAALHCLYVAVEMLPQDPQGLQLKAHDVVGNKRNLDDIAQCFDEESSLFLKLCTEIPLEDQSGECDAESDGKEATTSSLLSLLLFFSDTKSAMEDSQSVVNLILTSVREKSTVCSAFLEAIKRQQLEAHSNISNNESEGSSSCSCDKDASDDKDPPKLSAKEMMRRRQQQILDKMRSQQMQFLSANSDAMADEAADNTRNDTDGQAMVDSDSDDSYDEAMESEEEVEEEDHEEEDEWGFPTGQVDVRLYLEHVSSAIAQIWEKQRRSQDRRRRRRRSTRSSSITAENDERGRSSSVSYDYGSLDDPCEECGLCRLPCDPRSRDSSFGFVGMILPTNMPHRIDKGASTSDVRPVASSRLPSLRVLRPGTADEMRLQLADSVIWSCGHAIHHSCLKAYLVSLWKQKHGRSPLEMASGEDRLLSERDMEFVCPICRRLSNCLVPRVSLGDLRHRASACVLINSCEYSDEEEEEKKDDGQDPLAFLQWLDTQMSFRDDSPVVKRLESSLETTVVVFRSKTSLSPGSQSSAGSPSSPGEQDSTEQDVSVEREIGAFCHEIVLRSVRAQLYLPTLLTSSIRDEGSLDVEMQQLSSECGAQTPAWQLLLHCLEVQLRVVALADITAAAVAFSTPSSLAWTVVEAPAEKQFESVMTRLNGLIFGQQHQLDHSRQLQAGDADDATDAALVGTPMLCHPRLLTCFAMRLMWRQSIATPNADVAAEQLLTEAFFSARVLFTAQVLQALAYLSIQDDCKPKEIRDFDQVESLRDASAWISLMLARSRLMDTASANKWSTAAMEEQVSVLCLPLAQQMLVLMDVVLPMPHHHHSDCSDSKTPESCAVCDGLFPAASTSTGPPTASALLEKCLRRLHLPPVRLFFHRQMFPSSQRALCQLWGAQLEAKAAVSRQQARAQALVAGGSPTQVHSFPLQRQVKLLSSRAAAVAAAGANSGLLIPLPRVYMDLFIRYNDKPTGVCHQCAQVPQHPGLCLYCGEVLCCFSPCCEAKEGGGVGECTQHAQRCGLGTGAFLLLRACTVILFLGNERRCVWGSLYVDKNGEEDPYLRRGKTLYLDQSRRLALETLLVSHSFSQNTAILQNTSRRDGRRY
ncbi:Zinc finger, RING/FYVE/PHD-type [Phytophthora cactorum]|nr:Zinc finger, RING/FYVE/PHD-type [Phytophthora cactorum]